MERISISGESPVKSLLWLLGLASIQVFALLTTMVGGIRSLSVGFKPPATIAQAQPTAKYDGSEGVLAAKGRHDPCVVPR